PVHAHQGPDGGHGQGGPGRGQVLGGDERRALPGGLGGGVHRRRGGIGRTEEQGAGDDRPADGTEHHQSAADGQERERPAEGLVVAVVRRGQDAVGNDLGHVVRGRGARRGPLGQRGAGPGADGGGEAAALEDLAAAPRGRGVRRGPHGEGAGGGGA